MDKIGFIGAGTVGTALAVKLKSKGYPVVAVGSRSKSSAIKLAQLVVGCRAYDTIQEAVDAAEIIFITTPDGAIATVAAQLSWRPGQKAVHCSGVESADLLKPARRAGAEVGSFHPLQSFADVDQAVQNLPCSTFAIEAEGLLNAILKDFAQALDGHVVSFRSQDKLLYHAAATMACNYLYTLVKLATDLWQTFGVSVPEATRALLPLLRGTLNNLEQVGLPNCLTGPIARGDSDTVRKHLQAIETQAPKLLSTYRELALQTIPIAVAKGGIDEETAEKMRFLLRINNFHYHGKEQ
jgi:predicted short-subunit dehydrogenase-like oxidoreductase (DUF2520 family)